MKTIASPALKALNLIEPQVKPQEFEITAYPDGGHIGEHIDTKTQTRAYASCPASIISPQRRVASTAVSSSFWFSETQPGQSVRAGTFVEIEPRTDTLVVFPSWLRHQVLPVRVPSGQWADAPFHDQLLGAPCHSSRGLWRVKPIARQSELHGFLQLLY